VGTEIAASAESPAGYTEIEAKILAKVLARSESQAAVYDGLTEDIIRRVCAPGQNCVDVGAAVGVILGQIVAAAPDGRHYAFEPIPQWAADLRRGFPGVNVIEAAASDVTGDATFSLVTASPFFSGLRPQRYPFADPGVKKITVRTVTLSEAIPADVPVSFLKIDVEGAEIQVLRGADQLLSRDHPVIVFEHGGKYATREYGTTTHDLWAILVDQHGYSVYRMADWLAGQPALTADEMLLDVSHGEFQFVAATSPAPPPR
jgi:FkbM family methyltransferase